MKKKLIKEFNDYKNIMSNDMKENIFIFNPTVLLPFMHNKNLDFNTVDSIKKVYRNKDNSEEISNNLLKELKLENNNVTSLKFIFHELIANIYDHSQFENAYVMGKR